MPTNVPYPFQISRVAIQYDADHRQWRIWSSVLYLLSASPSSSQQQQSTDRRCWIRFLFSIVSTSFLDLWNKRNDRSFTRRQWPTIARVGNYTSWKELWWSLYRNASLDANYYHDSSCFLDDIAMLCPLQAYRSITRRRDANSILYETSISYQLAFGGTTNTTIVSMAR